MRRYTHVYTPTNGIPVREVSLVSIGNQYNTWQTHTRGFHPTDPYEGFPCKETHTGFPSVLLPRSETPSCQQCAPIWTHAYIHTIHVYMDASWIDVLVYGGGNKRERETKIEIGSGKDWLMTTYICTLYYPPRFHPHCCLRSQNPDYQSGGHTSPLPQRTAVIRAH